MSLDWSCEWSFAYLLLCAFSFSETGSYNVAQAGFQLSILLFIFQSAGITR
jgi:hypothetical protein